MIIHCTKRQKNTRVDVVNTLGRNLDKIYDLADVYHCDNIDNVSGEFVEKEVQYSRRKMINVENVNMQSTYWDISGKYIKINKKVSEKRGIYSDRCIDKGLQFIY